MIRRPRVKVALNLSAGRRSTNKGSEEIPKNNKSDEIKAADVVSGTAADDDANVSAERDPAPAAAVDNGDSAIIRSDNASSSGDLSENVADSSCPAAGLDNKVSGSSETSSTSQSADNTFKTPMKMTKNDSDTSAQSSMASKYRKFKFAPRLDSFRNVGKPQQEKDDVVQRGDDSPSQKEENAMIASQSSTTPVSPATPSDVRRPQTPHELMQQPHFSQQHPKEPSSVIVNHNIAYPALSQSPFPYHGHGRIRTESVTSLKSSREYTVANLHPRKSFREDQKMLDIKRESRERLSKKDIDKSKLRMFDMIYFNPQNNPMKPRPAIKLEKVKLDLKKEPSPSPEPEKSSSAVLVPRLKLNASGEMVLDESSLVVENEQQRQNRILIANNTVVYDDELSGSYGIYKRQQRTKEWLHDETVKFYRCLNTVGTDFSMMLNLFPNRTRRDLKLKFKKEEKNNPHLVDKALLKHNVFDLDELQRDLDQEEAEKRKKREESSKSEVKEHLKRKILKNQEAKLKAEERSRSKIEKILSDGDLALKIAEENQLKENLDVKKKRKYTRKSKEETTSTAPNDGLQMLAGFPGLSDKSPTDRRRGKKKKADEAEGEEQPVAKITKLSNAENAIKSPVRPAVIQFSEPEPEPEITTHEAPPAIVDFTNMPIEIHTDDTSLQQCRETSESATERHIEDVDSMICFDDVQSEPNETFEKSPTKNHTLLVSRNEWENVGDEPNGISYPLFVPDEPVESTMILPDEIEPVVASQAAADVPEQSKAAEPTPSTSAAAVATTTAKPKHKSKKKKFKPTLITRMKLDANGEMVPEDAQEEEEPPKAAALVGEFILPENVEPKQPVDDDAYDAAVSENFIKANDQLEQPQPEFQEEPQPSTSWKVQEEKSDPTDEFDDEAFLRSLDLDNLAIVEAHKEGDVCYEIYKSDPVTQEILGEPLNLPQKYIDLIVKLMTQPEDEDESYG